MHRLCVCSSQATEWEACSTCIENWLACTAALNGPQGQPFGVTITLSCPAQVGPSGRVLAFDKDPKRLKRLRDNVARCGAGGIVTARCADILALDTSADEFAEVCGGEKECVHVCCMCFLGGGGQVIVGLNARISFPPCLPPLTTRALRRCVQ